LVWGFIKMGGSRPEKKKKNEDDWGGGKPGGGGQDLLKFLFGMYRGGLMIKGGP